MYCSQQDSCRTLDHSTKISDNLWWRTGRRSWCRARSHLVMMWTLWVCIVLFFRFIQLRCTSIKIKNFCWNWSTIPLTHKAKLFCQFVRVLYTYNVFVFFAFLLSSNMITYIIPCPFVHQMLSSANIWLTAHFCVARCSIWWLASIENSMVTHDTVPWPGVVKHHKTQT